MPLGQDTADIDAFRDAALRCPIPQSVELIGEKWAFLILRGAFNGLQHFEEFQAARVKTYVPGLVYRYTREELRKRAAQRANRAA